jgi:hypothetical protein
LRSRFHRNGIEPEWRRAIAPAEDGRVNLWTVWTYLAVAVVVLIVVSVIVLSTLAGYNRVHDADVERRQ